MWWLGFVGCQGETGTINPTPTVTDPTGETGTTTDPIATADTGEVATPEHTAAETGDSGTAPEPICPEPAGAPQLATSSGCVVGTVLPSGREQFQRIPFAIPPLGARRFAPPEPAPPWTEPLDGTQPAPICVQFHDATLSDLKLGDGEEDCLYLNVTRPAGASGLPLLFFVHGGGHLNGSGTEEVYLGDPGLASDAVLVTVNYRLGPLGYLAHPELSAADPDGVSGNVGVQDVLAALRWVNDNAEALGGDPDRIQLFGESAGALETCALLGSARATGLFDTAIAQSGPCQTLANPLRDPPPLVTGGEEQGVAFAEAAGCADVACLRALPVERLVELGQSAPGPATDGWKWAPWLDGVWLPDDLVGAMSSGAWNRVPFLATVNQDEGTLFTLGLAPNQAAFDAWLTTYALVLGVPRRTLEEQYDPGRYGGTEQAFAALFGDAVFVCPTVWQQRALAAQVPAFGGWWTESIPVLGAYHASEVRYVFGTGPFLPAGADASDRLQGAWTSMADGAPVLSDLASWPTADDAWVEISEDPSRVVPPPRADACATFEGSTIDVW